MADNNNGEVNQISNPNEAPAPTSSSAAPQENGEHLAAHRDGAVELDLFVESQTRVANRKGGRGRKPRSSRQKIVELVNVKKKLKRKLQQLETNEVETEDDYLYMDKVRTKLLKIEKALYDADVYEDAQPIDPTSFSMPMITVANSGLQPLNELLTKFVNDMSENARYDKQYGFLLHIASFRHVMPDDVSKMLDQLKKEGHGELVDHLLTSTGESKLALAQTHARIAENTNKWCRYIRLGDKDNRLINYEEWVEPKDMHQIDAFLAFEGLQNGNSSSSCSGHPDGEASEAQDLIVKSKSIVGKLIILAEKGELPMGGEPSASIDLDDRKAGDADEKRGSSDDDEEDDVAAGQKEGEGSQGANDVGEGDVPAEGEKVPDDDIAAEGEKAPNGEASGDAQSDANGDEGKEDLAGDEEGDDIDDIDLDGEIDLLSDAAGEEDGDQKMDEIASDGCQEEVEQAGDDGSVQQIAEAIQRLPNGTAPSVTTMKDCEVIELDSDSEDGDEVQQLD